MFYLASASPRRQNLLHLCLDKFEIIVPHIDERLLDPFLSPKELSKEEAKWKAYAVFQEHPNDEVLACDTIVVLHNKALGKPEDEEDAVKMLLEEAGETQTVLTSYVYLSPNKEIARTVKSKVTFNPLTEAEIRAYVKKYRPLDKAGAYGIQDDAPLIKAIEGSYNNVMGLPTEDLMKHVFNRRK